MTPTFRDEEAEDEEAPAAPPAPLPPLLVVPEEAAGMRLDTWLARRPGAPSRNRIQQLVKDGHVRIGGRAVQRSHEVVPGEEVTVEWPPLDDAWPFPEDIPIDIVYDDDEVVVVNKQAGLIVHPSAGNPDGTLVNALLHRYPNLPGINGIRRPGIVHRLDKDTTGLLVVAKTERAMSSLAKQLQARTMKRTYVAIAIGDPAWNDTVVDAAIGRDVSNRLKRAIDGPGAKEARSHFRVLRRAWYFTMIEARLESGRTHQIRIHLKHIGHPIICDANYDGHLQRCLERLGNGHGEVKRLLAAFDRPWLHARNLEFHHPGLNRHMRFEVPPPPESIEVARAIFGEGADPHMGRRDVSKEW